MKIKTIVFDLDGVIIESADIKTEAFRELFSGFPQHLDRIIQYHIDNSGISRFEKFEFIYKNFLKKQYSPELSRRLGERFQELVLKKVIACPVTEGALEFLSKYYCKLPLYIVSGTPESELNEILSQKGLQVYFSGTFGSSKSKDEWLKLIIDKEQIKAENLLFVGDALSDYYAGVAAGTLFIGRILPGEKNIFPSEHTLATIDNLNQLLAFLESYNRNEYPIT